MLTVIPLKFLVVVQNSCNEDVWLERPSLNSTFVIFAIFDDIGYVRDLGLMKKSSDEGEKSLAPSILDVSLFWLWKHGNLEQFIPIFKICIIYILH